MADIARYPLVRHLRGSTTTYVEHVRRGKTVRAGVGASFWFRPLSAVLNEVPADDRELPLLFHARTSDFQDVTVQATVTYRFADPATAAGRIDFSIDPDTGRWRATPLDQVAGLLTETAQQYAIDLLAGDDLTAATVGGVGPVRDVIAAGLGADQRLAETGIAVVGVRVVAVRPEPEVEKALRTPTRELVQQEADKATFERRAIAVERERAIGENELQTKIELARREEQLVAQRGANARREAEEAAAAGAISTEAEARRKVTLAEARAEETRLAGAARGDAEAAHVAAYRDLPEGVLLGLALKELAGNLPKIDTVVLTPDLLTKALAKFGGEAR
ncbi:SPFH domain / Band 7 family protein [Saccharopolyspora antimicrobica]|uniref:SPFH domain / Band 7 family protein n=1 Tax=Saccharopolyspora antimicrobica TaxID=455193 RepID=A0A1I5DWA6_9PSEU|nr:SPFH domain-containing protein [Saccharopolyspora antimicrobica]RKT84964.1 SPFH domain/Band 7 family protein [Saccharopolyspora antimicrobica]SFO03417.1 SPFH domain / Band 7 family protein [Saccharopolyspora antimicrobica]